MTCSASIILTWIHLRKLVALAFLSQMAARANGITSMFLAGGSTEGKYLAHWPEYFIVAEAPGGELMGYIMGKAEGSVAREEWHGHVTALSVAPEFRRLGLAAKLMELLEEISERVSNQVAVNMYKQLGYSVYRTVIEYYSASNGEPDEDAYDMRKALSRDTEKKSIIPLPHPVRPEDIE
ncbi:N-alpha-acetyltransferase 20 isoform X1 [Pteropus vampyrus]|uniref:N-alpha-acetyltransferase 20 n=1 Tax=Pteropus vampyrus TaxID=132908 RepID=A0A6P6D182_PTEVA|nr:N-alpha-acetyltransferase 20 isoform X1 [Pteropus vampyrus]